MLEKTFSTFHASNLLLQQQYRERGFKKYYDLISCLLVAEQNNELLMINHESCPTRFAPLSEANMVAYNQSGGRGRGSERGRGRGHGRGRGRDQGRGFGRGKGVEVNLAYQDEKNDSFDIDNFGIDSLGVDNLGVPEDLNDITHLDVGDFLNMDRVAQHIIDDEDIFLVDSATTHTIVKKEKYFSHLNLQESNVNTNSGSAKLIKDYGKAHILLPEVIMEYLVKISKKARILELKRRHLKITVLTSYTLYPSRKTRRICACTSQKTTKE
ncbi:hypothetical protein Tco_1369878 [Tanacetum coccineum]